MHSMGCSEKLPAMDSNLGQSETQKISPVWPQKPQRCLDYGARWSTLVTSFMTSAAGVWIVATSFLAPGEQLIEIEHDKASSRL